MTSNAAHQAMKQTGSVRNSAIALAGATALWMSSAWAVPTTIDFEGYTDLDIGPRQTTVRGFFTFDPATTIVAPDLYGGVPYGGHVTSFGGPVHIEWSWDASGTNLGDVIFRNSADSFGINFTNDLPAGETAACIGDGGGNGPTDSFQLFAELAGFALSITDCSGAMFSASTIDATIVPITITDTTIKTCCSPQQLIAAEPRTFLNYWNATQLTPRLVPIPAAFLFPSALGLLGW